MREQLTIFYSSDATSHIEKLQHGKAMRMLHDHLYGKGIRRIQDFR